MPWSKKKDTQPANTLIKDKPRAHSYSSWSLYHRCPYAYKCRYITKVPTPPHKAMDRGTDLHKEAEDFVNGEIKRIQSKEWKPFIPRLKKRMTKPCTPELDLAFNREWSICGWKDDTAWVRMKLDLASPLVNQVAIVDYKTGKIYDTHRDQSDLYGLGSMLEWPDVHDHVVSFWYLDQKVIHHYEYSVSDVEKLKTMWTRRFLKVEKDTLYAPKPSTHCRWCAYSKKRGGPCLVR